MSYHKYNHNKIKHIAIKNYKKAIEKMKSKRINNTPTREKNYLQLTYINKLLSIDDVELVSSIQEVYPISSWKKDLKHIVTCKNKTCNECSKVTFKFTVLNNLYIAHSSNLDTEPIMKKFITL